MAAEIELPEHVFVHGYLLMDGEKMSKSLGNVLDPFAVIERFGADALRFYLLREVPFGQDGSVSTRLVRAALRERAGQRARQPRQPHDRDARALPRRDGARRRARPGAAPRTSPGCPSASREHLDRAELTLALDEIWQRVRRLNRYVEEQAPWQLAKDEARAEDLDRVLRTLAEGLRVVTVLLWPYLPASAERLLAALGAPGPVARRRRARRRRDRARQPDRVAVPQGPSASAGVTVIDSPHPPGPVRAARRRARRGGRARRASRAC